MTTAKTNTRPVVCVVSLRLGQTTFLVSVTASRAKAMKRLPACCQKEAEEELEHH